MRLGLSVIEEALGEFPTRISGDGEAAEFEEVRFCDGNRDGSSGEKRNDTDNAQILYVGSARDIYSEESEDTLCVCGKEMLRVQNAQTGEVLNTILQVFGQYARWNERCDEMIAEGEAPAALLNLFEDLCGFPLLIVDREQFIAVMSSGVPSNRSDPVWRQILENKNIPKEILKEFNQQYEETFTKEDVFYLPATHFPTEAFCRHIFLKGERFATVVLLFQEKRPSPGQLYLFSMFTDKMRSWVKRNMTEEQAGNTASYLLRFLDGIPGTEEALERFLFLRGWDRNHRLSVTAASGRLPQIHYDEHLARALTSGNPDIYAVSRSGRIILLCNHDLFPGNEIDVRLKQHLKKDSYQGGISVPFTGIRHIKEALNQAEAALDKAKEQDRILYCCRDMAMEYILRKQNRVQLPGLLHGIPSCLRQYDTEHGTAYYRTLFVFLQQERSHQKTAEMLFIHRNTLFKRLNRIQELWDPELEDPEQRFYLLYSFYQMKYREEAPEGQEEQDDIGQDRHFS